MNRQAAEELMDAMEQFRNAFNAATATTQSMDNVEEAKVIRKILGGVVASLDDLIRTVCAQYPDLDPDS